MKLTRSVSYAVGILLRVHQHRTTAPVTAAMIAEGCEFPPRFLYRVLRRLVDAGLLTGVSGPGGGYALARDVGDVTLLEVVQAVEGPIEPTLLEPVCRRQKKSIDAINQLCRHSASQFSAQLAEITVARLAVR